MKNPLWRISWSNFMNNEYLFKENNLQWNYKIIYENYYAFFKRDIFMEKEKEKDFYYSNNNFFIYTHIQTQTYIFLSQTFWNQVNAS